MVSPCESARDASAMHAGMRLADSAAVDHQHEGQLLTDLWETHDGTRACAVEHGAGCLELHVIRRGRIISRRRCATFDELIAAAMTAHRALLTAN
jgi:hypothetical protein